MVATTGYIKLYVLLIIAASFSSFTFVHAEDSSKSDEKDASISDDTSSQEDSKEKRSREEIMFGNQQNKPNGLVDDLMGMADNLDDDENYSLRLPDKKSNASQPDDQKEDETAKDEKNEKRTARPADEDEQNDMMMGSGAENWYNTVPVSSSALQYLANSPTRQSLAPEEFANSLYDQEDLYRRKRQLLGHPLNLRKRSLRSSIGQMIQKRGIRTPRRSMRLKRQVDMDDLLSLFGNDGYQVNHHSFSGRATTVEKRNVPNRISGYPETPAPEFRYPYIFQNRDDGILSAGNDFDDSSNDGLDSDSLADVDSLMLLPPNSRYVEGPEIGLSPYRSQKEENEAIRKWLSRHTTPSVFSVSRRSAPFYPLDYRYISGYKKRSRFFNNNGNRFSGDEDQDTDFGKWGHVVQVPEAYASAEDVARLYGLANLMAEGDEASQSEMRRSA
ncbi:uncharacterized protein LOC118199106 isoform X1 [Stegodyphus dumicola]|uniref:uncharacterized protein LOC118199106 isoform X1 n=1 Tax=Stegodyphus dumicola TaxID=202533 RepID=UPI0015A9F67B|nr:uncharacterized protein LOC118199106 isoform X1 [Stegodyphus dumicola]